MGRVCDNLAVILHALGRFRSLVVAPYHERGCGCLADAVTMGVHCAGKEDV
jgi:hypothetical protein